MGKATVLLDESFNIDVMKGVRAIQFCRRLAICLARYFDGISLKFCYKDVAEYKRNGETFALLCLDVPWRKMRDAKHDGAFLYWGGSLFDAQSQCVSGVKEDEGWVLAYFGMNPTEMISTIFQPRLREIVSQEFLRAQNLQNQIVYTRFWEEVAYKF